MRFKFRNSVEPHLHSLTGRLITIFVFSLEKKVVKAQLNTVFGCLPPPALADGPGDARQDLAHAHGHCTGKRGEAEGSGRDFDMGFGLKPITPGCPVCR